MKPGTSPCLRTRLMQSEQDWWRVRNLLIETHSITGPEFNWEIRHWEGNRFHDDKPYWDPEPYRRFCLWETEEERLVGLAHNEGDELCLQIHPDFRAQIEAEMIAYGEEHFAEVNADGKRQLHVLAYEYDDPRRKLLEQRGFEKMTYGWISRWMHLTNQPLPEPEVAEGYIMRTTYTEAAGELHDADCQRMADLLNAAFNRTFHQAGDYHCFMTRTPLFRNELNLVMAAPDGSFAAHAAVCYDEANRYGIFEPVCTHPAHRQKGLAKALMLEGLRRARALGATHIQVSTGDAAPANALYDSIGFTEYYKAYYWKKTW